MAPVMQLVITNLHLLHFPEVHSIHPNTFSVIADHKLTDILFHFLLNKLNPAKAHKVFRMIIPPEDFTTKREFRTIVYQWLEEIKPYFILGSAVLRKSLLDEGRGERFQELVFALSTYTLQVVMKKNFPESNVPDLVTLHSKSTQHLDDRLRSCQAKYLLCLQDHVAKQETWKTYSQTLIQENKDLDTTLTEIDQQRHLRKRRRSSSSFYSTQQQWIDTSIQFAHAWHKLVEHPWEYAHSQLQTALTQPKQVLKGTDPTHPMDWTRLVHLADVSLQPLTETTLDTFHTYLHNVLHHHHLELDVLETKLNGIQHQLDHFPELEVGENPPSQTSTIPTSTPADPSEPPLTLGFPTIHVRPSSPTTSAHVAPFLGPYLPHASLPTTQHTALQTPPARVSRGSVHGGSMSPKVLSSAKKRTPNTVTTPVPVHRTGLSPHPSSLRRESMHLLYSDDLSAFDMSDTELLNDIDFQTYMSPRSSS